ncbi:MAG TPA: hypothetical protein VG265_03625 [Gaiellaceae bacterium]|nr:hypothetical protein [Gaiellaceae bacterium]
MILERRSYTLELLPGAVAARLSSPSGEHWLTLSLVSAFDRVGAVDETLAVDDVRLVGDELAVERTSTAWAGAGLRLECGEETLVLRAWVEGAGDVTDVHLLGGRLLPSAGTGFVSTGTSFRTLFSANPGDPAKILRGASEPAILGVSGDGTPGRGHWFFTPPPLYVALAPDEVDDPDASVDGGWLALGIAAAVSELRFVSAAYVPGDRAFHLLLEHEGHTTVRGRFEAPALILQPGQASAYEGLRAHRGELVRLGAAPAVRTRREPEWWREPIFCGWGAQCHLSRLGRGPAAKLATQENYDAFLEALEEHGVEPGTVVLDDKWQSTYGLNEPDPVKWPDLRRWIADRRDRGSRVLLWWKAWDPEGVPDELCIRRPDGLPVAIDPTNPAARELLREVMGRLVGRSGLGADGLKIDFTGRTPSGSALVAHGRGWGIALLHDLLSLVYAAVKEANPDALVITHTPHPAFVDVTDMIRLNDVLRLDDPGPPPTDAVVPQMRYRAGVVRAAVPELPIDTDDWCLPDRRTWRAFLEAKPALGVPSLYYATHLDATGEALEDDDYEAIRRVWGRREWRP